MPAQEVAIRPVESSRSVLTFPHTQNFFTEMEELTNEIARHAFSLFDQRGQEHGHDLEDWMAAEKEVLSRVPIEIVDSGDSLKVRALVPGFDPANLDLSLEADALVIQGNIEARKEEEKVEGKYSEFSARKIFRRLCLPSLVDPATARAELRNGVLEVTMNKTTKPAHIAIQAA